MSRELRDLLAQVATQGAWESEITGRLGKPLGSGLFEIDADGELGHVYIETETGVVKALNTGIPRLARFPVRMSRNPDGVLLAKPDWMAALKFLGDTAQTISAFVPPHTHRLGSGLDDDVEGLRLIPGRVRAYIGMEIYIDPFPYRYNGVEMEWLGGTLDLTPYQGTTAGTWRFVKVGIEPVSNTPIGVAGSDFLQTVPLDRAFLDEISFIGYIPCGAVRVKESDTEILFKDNTGNYRFEDCRLLSGIGADPGLSNIVVGSDGNVVTMNGEVVWAA